MNNDIRLKSIAHFKVSNPANFRGTKAHQFGDDGVPVRGVFQKTSSGGTWVNQITRKPFYDNSDAVFSFKNK